MTNTWEQEILENQREGFDLIWRRFPERQIRSSTVWWYIMLMPRQAEGYGPKQMMFSLNCMACDSFMVNKEWYPGFDRQITKNGEDELLNAVALGWFYDGQKTHKKLVNHGAPAVLSPKGFITAWSAGENGRKLGGEFMAHGDRPFGIRGAFRGKEGGVRFEAWGDPASNTTSPGYVYDYDFKLAGFHVVSWRHLNFAGEVSYPGGTEVVEGIGYFQRVIFDVPLFPWRWVWTAFEDGSIFSCTIAYAGPQLIRRSDRFYPDILENAILPVNNAGFFHRNGTREAVNFDKAKVTRIDGDKYPGFTVECSSANGDFIRFEVVPHSHLQYLLERPILRGRRLSYFNYNEYPFRVANLEGVVNGEAINHQTVGNGFGNCEYTWGLFL